MANTSVPFVPSADEVPLEEDYRDIPRNLAASIEVLLSSLLPSDVVSSMEFVAKVTPTTPDDDWTTIALTITPTLSPDGVISATTDGTVRRGVFALTATQTFIIGLAASYRYFIQATVVRGDETLTQTIQSGALFAPLTPHPARIPIADGTYFANGVIFASGFPI